jgi:hypothetical protein
MKFFLFGFAAGCLFLLSLFIGLGFGSKTEQPISFNHKKHLEQGLECDSCHRYFKNQMFAGMPDIATCLECHKEPITKSLEEEKIRKFAQKGEEILWKRLYEEPDYVFFSHQNHVILGKIQCQTCHGNIGESERPPSRTFEEMTMDWCMGCHKKHRVTNDCLACHV